MRRILCEEPFSAIAEREFDAVIVGGGLAGVYTALNLPDSMRVLLLLKRDARNASSWYAQGGVAAVTLPEDSFEAHIRDTLAAGAGLCDEAAVRVLVTEGPDRIRDLTALGVPFDRTPAGRIDVGREGSHSYKRIIHCGKDVTGRVILQRLYEQLLARPQVEVRAGAALCDVVTDEKGVCGVVYDAHGMHYVPTRRVVLATGGVGRLYRFTTNPSASTGDGIDAARRAGAALKNMEFVQFHPTGFARPDSHGQVFLISEAVRGDGGLLYDGAGRRIMEGKHPLEDLAPRDVVAREIWRRMRETGEECAYLDICSKGPDFARERFPHIYDTCLSAGVDITRERIPVIPTQHYFMGGVATDLWGRTSVAGLWCVGESACTGVHGANRLASNSLLECLVFGRRSAQDLAGYEACALSVPQREAGNYAEDRERADDYRDSVRRVMTADGGIVRNARDLTKGIARLDRMIEDLEARRLCRAAHREVLHMASVGREILAAALARRESVGGHYREDERKWN